ncbi:MAG: disulfide bond formation protein B [Pseudomonadota bacterium]
MAITSSREMHRSAPKTQGDVWLILLAAAGILATAWAFELIGGFAPCPLCLKQRWAYYFALPALLAAALVFRGDARGAGGLLIALVALAFVANAVLAGYHAGAEWKFWPGPSTCAGGAGGVSQGLSADDLFSSLDAARVVRCDAAAGRFLGLSFAGWNVIASMGLALASYRVLWRASRPTA